MRGNRKMEGHAGTLRLGLAGGNHSTLVQRQTPLRRHVERAHPLNEGFRKPPVCHKAKDRLVGVKQIDSAGIGAREMPENTHQPPSHRYRSKGLLQKARRLKFNFQAARRSNPCWRFLPVPVLYVGSVLRFQSKGFFY